MTEEHREPLRADYSERVVCAGEVAEWLKCALL